MQKLIKYILILMLVLVAFISCEKDDGIKSQENELKLDLKTVSPMDVATAFKMSSSNKSTQPWITPYFQFNDSIGLTNSSAQITVTPVITSVSNTYSRMFSIEVNGNIESVLYHMIPNDLSTYASFWGKVVVSDLNGNIRAAFDVEDNLYTSYYDLLNYPETINILQDPKNNSNKSNGGVDGNNNDNGDDPCDGCAWQEELEEVTVTAPPNEGLSTGIIILFVPELFPNDEEDGGVTTIPNTEPTEPTAPAGGTNENSCPPGQIKDDNGNCVDPPEECPDENMIRDENNICVCKSGYAKDINGKCKKIPCENDPVVNPTVAAQENSGVNGGRYGCTRTGLPLCPGSTTKRKHHGLDVLNPYGAPVFAMYDGTATPISKEYASGGWILYQTATVNGETISIQYMHLQEENRASGTINAGDIIGYQGDSGNLAGAIKKGSTESHVHIKIKDSSGNSLDPENFIANINTTPDSEPTITNNDCN